MPIDDCKHTFMRLAGTILPAHMRRLRDAMKTPVQARLFGKAKQGPKAIARQLKLPRDFPGCYVLWKRGRKNAIYVGISRKVLARIRQHLCGKTHFDASLAYRMAKREVPTRLQRREAMLNPTFKKVFDERQAHLQRLLVSFIEIKNDLEIYLFEAFCAMELHA